MSDSVRMIDLVALSKNLDSVRRFDPENRAAVQRLAGAAAAHRVEEHHKDVEESRESDEALLRDREGKQRRRDPGRDPDAAPEHGAPAEPAPESDEGHLLDLKV